MTGAGVGSWSEVPEIDGKSQICQVLAGVSWGSELLSQNINWGKSKFYDFPRLQGLLALRLGKVPETWESTSTFLLPRRECFKGVC